MATGFITQTQLGDLMHQAGEQRTMLAYKSDHQAFIDGRLIGPPRIPRKSAMTVAAQPQTQVPAPKISGTAQPSPTPTFSIVGYTPPTGH